MTSLPSAAEIVVVGAGAIGASVAYALARDGHEVVVLDRGTIGMGASSGTACMVTASHAERMASRAMLLEGIRFLPNPAGPFSLRPTPRLLPWLARFTAASLAGDAHGGTALLRRLALESVELHRGLAAALDTGLVQHGTLNVYLSDAGLAGRAAAVAEHRDAGMDVELLDAGDVRERQPAILGARGAAFYPDDAHVDSLQYTRRLAEAATSLGARVREGVDVLGVVRSAAQLRIDTTEGPISAQKLVLAAGVWSPRLARELGTRLPITGAKGYHVEFAGLEAAVRQPAYLYETRVVATPLAGRVRLAGTLELGSDPDAVGRRRIAAVIDAGTRHIAGVAGARVSHVWRGLRPMSSDGMPIIGRIPADDRVLVATGHGVARHHARALDRRARGVARRRRRARALAGPAGSRALPPALVLAAPHEAADCRHHLVGARISRRGVVGAHHAVLGVIVEQAQGDLVERGLDRGDLGQDVDAVALVLDHALDPADLSLDALEPRLDGAPCWRCSRDARFSGMQRPLYERAPRGSRAGAGSSRRRRRSRAPSSHPR